MLLLQLSPPISCSKYLFDNFRVVSFDYRVPVNSIISKLRSILFRKLIVLSQYFLFLFQKLNILIVYLTLNRLIICIIMSLWLLKPTQGIQFLLIVMLVTVFDALLNIVGISLSLNENF
jgi:hypothetical protein